VDLFVLIAGILATGTPEFSPETAGEISGDLASVLVEPGDKWMVAERVTNPVA